MRNFKVPKSMVQKTLAGMLGGESAYTVPWALLVANDRSATLDVDMLAYTQPGGTVSMYVTRVGAKKWTVDLSKVPNDYVFTTSSHKSEHQVVENSEYIESVSVTHWEPRWEPPTISARCPSCGTVAERGASAWALRSPVVRATMACGCGRVWEVTAPEPESVTDFPTDAERQVAYARCIDMMRPHHRHLPGEDITCACSDEHTDDVLTALAPLIRAREAAAWDKGYMRGRFPFTHEGQDDPIPPRVGPAKFGSNANPYRQEADNDRN